MAGNSVDWSKIEIDEIFPEDSQYGRNDPSIPVAPPRHKTNFKKKNAAPVSQGGPLKFGNYVPKIYDDTEGGNNDVKPGVTAAQVHKADEGEIEIKNTSYLMIGDKHKPLIFGENINDQPQEMRLQSPKSGRKTEMLAEIPDSVAKGFDAQKNIYNYGETVSNPLYDKPVAPPRRHRQQIEDTSPTPVPKPRHKHHNSEKGTHSPDRNEDYPYIPAPDYDLDDSEVIMTLTDDNESPKRSRYQKKNRRIYKEFEGDDFGQYLSDDEDYEFDTASNISYTWRKDIRYKQRPPPNTATPPRKLSNSTPKSQSQAKMKKFSGKDLKPQNKQKSQEFGRNTIRNFSFANSKLAGGDRTVKSTSAIGRQAKSKERPHLRDSIPSGSYEDFLRSRNGDNGSLESNDSGLEMEDSKKYKIFEKNQPHQLKKDRNNRDSLWQKLTWRFKKNVSVYDMGSR